MTSYTFELSSNQLQELIEMYPNMGKNSHVGNHAIIIVQLFFKSKYTNVTFSKGQNGADIQVAYNGIIESFEIKRNSQQYHSLVETEGIKPGML